MNIKERRQALRLTQQQLAEASGINKRQLQKVEAGEIQIGNVTLTNAAKLAKALGVTIEELLQ